MANSFKEKHEKLIEEENNLKEKLQTEVTKTKEKLEFFLSEMNDIIKCNEKINKGIKFYEKEIENNFIKNLSYVSKINKIQNKNKKLFCELMRNIKIFFDKENNSIKCEDYYFSGIQIPKNIEIKEIKHNSFKLFWKMDEINILNIDNKQTKFIVEIRKKKSNDKFKKVYEDKNTNCLIDNLSTNTNYEIRICCLNNDLYGAWSEIKKVKTSIDIDSIILRESKRKDEFLEKIIEWSGCQKCELLYKGTEDGSDSRIFHNKCNNKGPTICLYKNEKGNIFGGYTSLSWTSEGGDHSAPESFIFTLTNIYEIQPTKFVNSSTNNNVYHNKDYGPTFHNDICIYKDFKKENRSAYSTFPESYKDTTNKGNSIFTGNSNNSETDFIIKEIEVFKVYK